MMDTLSSTLTRAAFEPVCALVVVPPRSGTTAALLAWVSCRGDSGAYAGGYFAPRLFLARRSVSLLASPTRPFASRVGGAVPLIGFFAAAVDGLLLNHAEAADQPTVDRAWEWVRSDLMPRIEPRGSLIVATDHAVDEVRARALGFEVIIAGTGGDGG